MVCFYVDLASASTCILTILLAFASFLQSNPLTTVEGIPQHQLQVASIERARQAQGYPSSEQLEERGVPPRLAMALAPFQRGGVDFVRNKDGRALIADGKLHLSHRNPIKMMVLLTLTVF